MTILYLSDQKTIKLRIFLDITAVLSILIYKLVYIRVLFI